MKRFFAAILLLSILLSFAACGEVIPNIFPTASGEEEGKHSELLVSVLNDSYYNSLINQVSGDDWMKYYDTPAYDAHPFAFLEDQGMDVDKILDGTYPAYTMSYVLDEEPNNLYIHTRVLIDDSYYQSYLVTYKLTDKEMSDYIMMHGMSGMHNLQKKHAFFLNDKISEMKQPTKVLETNFTKETFDKFRKQYQKYKFILPSINEKDDEYSLIVYTQSSSSTIAAASSDFIIGTLRGFVHSSENGANYIPSASRYSLISREEKEAQIFTLQDVSICNSQELDTESKP